jgi:hypothetical protein
VGGLRFLALRLGNNGIADIGWKCLFHYILGRERDRVLSSGRQEQKRESEPTHGGGPGNGHALFSRLYMHFSFAMLTILPFPIKTPASSPIPRLSRRGPLLHQMRDLLATTMVLFAASIAAVAAEEDVASLFPGALVNGRVDDLKCNVEAIELANTVHIAHARSQPSHAHQALTQTTTPSGNCTPSSKSLPSRSAVYACFPSVLL